MTVILQVVSITGLVEVAASCRPVAVERAEVHGIKSVDE